MPLAERSHTPWLGGATGWLNTEPLGPAELRDHVVLVDFWTLTCINWLRTAPHIRAWSRVDVDDGLIVIGVHTPEFSFERDVDRVLTKAAHGHDIYEQGNGVLDDGRLDQLVQVTGDVLERTAEITFFESGAEGDSFTFG